MMQHISTLYWGHNGAAMMLEGPRRLLPVYKLTIKVLLQCYLGLLQLQTADPRLCKLKADELHYLSSPL